MVIGSHLPQSENLSTGFFIDLIDQTAVGNWSREYFPKLEGIFARVQARGGNFTRYNALLTNVRVENRIVPLQVRVQGKLVTIQWR